MSLRSQDCAYERGLRWSGGIGRRGAGETIRRTEQGAPSGRPSLDERLGRPFCFFFQAAINGLLLVVGETLRLHEDWVEGRRGSPSLELLLGSLAGADE